MSLARRLSMIFKTFVLGQPAESGMLDQTLLEYDNALKGNAQVQSDGTSRERHSFAMDGMRVSTNLRGALEIVPVMARVQLAFVRSVRMAGGGHKEPTANEPAFVERLAQMARDLGASDVGYCQLTPDLVYAGKEIPYRNAIVVTRPMNRDHINTAPSLECMIEVQRTYGDLGILVNKLAKRIRRAGFDAVPGPALGGAVDYPSLARRAGLGEQGRHGLLISPGNGACQRIAAVFTNLELPRPTRIDDHAWIRDFCQTCGRCIRACPVGAIRETPESRPAKHLSSVDGDKCLGYFGTHYGCSVCVKACPFTNRDYEEIRNAFQREPTE